MYNIAHFSHNSEIFTFAVFKHWLSEIFVDITEKQPSINFYNAAKEKLKTVENEEFQSSISVELEYMKEILGNTLIQKNHL